MSLGHPQLPPSSPGGGGHGGANGGVSSPADRRAKMMRQRQLMLERQRNASRTALGVMANHDLPTVGTSPSRQKQGLVLLANFESPPGSFAEAKKEPCSPPPEAKSRWRDPAGAGASGVAGQVPGSKEEAWPRSSELDGIDVEVLRANTPPVRDDAVMGSRPRPEDGVATGGWDLNVEVQRAASKGAVSGEEEKAQGKRRGWRPWRGNAKQTQASGTSSVGSGVCMDEVTMLVPIEEESPGRLSPARGTPGWGNGSFEPAPHKAPPSVTTTDVSPLASFHLGVQDMPGRLSTPPDVEPRHFSRPGALARAPSGRSCGFEEVQEIAADLP